MKKRGGEGEIGREEERKGRREKGRKEGRKRGRQRKKSYWIRTN